MDYVSLDVQTNIINVKVEDKMKLKYCLFFIVSLLVLSSCQVQEKTKYVCADGSTVSYPDNCPKEKKDYSSEKPIKTGDAYGSCFTTAQCSNGGVPFQLDDDTLQWFVCENSRCAQYTINVECTNNDVCGNDEYCNTRSNSCQKVE